MARDRNKLNTLEVLTEIYAYSSGLKTTFDQYVDTRFESSLDIQSRLSIKALENNAYAGNKVEVEGIVLRVGPLPGADLASQFYNEGDYFRRVTAENKILGLDNPPPLSSARVKILPRKGEHASPTDIYYDPYTYDANDEDKYLISQFPLFFYKSNLTIEPGVKVRALYDYGTFSSGMILERLPDEIINLATGSADNPLAKKNFNSKSNAGYTGDQVDSRGRLVPATAAGCSDSRTGMAPPQGILNEPIVRSEIVPNAYGGYIRGKESFVRKVETAYLSMQTQGIDLIIGDTYRPYQVQKDAYMTKGQPGQSKAGDIAHPCKGYHTQGQALDIAQNSAQKADILAHGPIYQALYAAGLRRISNEYWHWSVGETDHGRDKVFARNRSGTSPADTFTG
jgi:hypothetical protein